MNIHEAGRNHLHVIGIGGVKRRSEWSGSKDSVCVRVCVCVYARGTNNFPYRSASISGPGAAREIERIATVVEPKRTGLPMSGSIRLNCRASAIVSETRPRWASIMWLPRRKLRVRASTRGKFEHKFAPGNRAEPFVDRSLAFSRTREINVQLFAGRHSSLCNV